MLLKGKKKMYIKVEVAQLLSMQKVKDCHFSRKILILMLFFIAKCWKATHLTLERWYNK